MLRLMINANIHAGDRAKHQCLMVMVADRRACETGVVLLLGINEYGEMIPQRLRIAAARVWDFYCCWFNGQGIDENCDENEEGEIDYLLGEDGWESIIFERNEDTGVLTRLVVPF